MVALHPALVGLCYAVPGLVVFAASARRRRGIEGGLGPCVAGLLWPVALVLLALYYVAAAVYTLLVVQRGRRGA